MAKNKLNPKQKLFCEYYAGGGDYFGNGTKAYILAYKINVPVDVEYRDLSVGMQSEYNTASADAVQLLRNTKVQKRCDELLDKLIEDKIVDRELAFVIRQRNELSPKIAAIREYDAVKGRVVKNIKVEGEIEVVEVPIKTVDEYIKHRKSKEKK